MAAGCGVQERYLYEDRVSGSKQARPGLTACLKALHPGDTLVVWKLDRLARSLIHLLRRDEGFQGATDYPAGAGRARGTSSMATADGKLFLTLLGGIRGEMIRERVIAGLEAARARGHHGGRRPKLTADDEAFRCEMAGRNADYEDCGTAEVLAPYDLQKSGCAPTRAGGGGGLEVAPHGHLYRYAFAA